MRRRVRAGREIEKAREEGGQSEMGRDREGQIGVPRDEKKGARGAQG